MDENISTRKKGNGIWIALCVIFAILLIVSLVFNYTQIKKIEKLEEHSLETEELLVISEEVSTFCANIQGITYQQLLNGFVQYKSQAITQQ